MIRRYRWNLPDASLDRLCEGGARISSYSAPTIDVDVASAPKDELDAAMAEFGFAPIEDNPTGTCGPLFPSPDGTLWRLEIDNAGNLKPVKEPAAAVSPP